MAPEPVLAPSVGSMHYIRDASGVRKPSQEDDFWMLQVYFEEGGSKDLALRPQLQGQRPVGAHTARSLLDHLRFWRHRATQEQESTNPQLHELQADHQQLVRAEASTREHIPAIQMAIDRLQARLNIVIQQKGQYLEDVRKGFDEFQTTIRRRLIGTILICGTDKISCVGKIRKATAKQAICGMWWSERKGTWRT